MKQLLFFLCILVGFHLSAEEIHTETIPITPAKTETQNTAPKKEETNEEEGFVTFTPPPGWHTGDISQLPKSVTVMVIGQGEHPFPPSMNLATQPFRGTLKQYLKIIKNTNDARGDVWKDLGMINTEAGPASLSQVDNKNEWGTIRNMHVILLKNKRIYILTAVATQDEFPKFYKDFFKSLRSLRVINNLYEMIPTQQRKDQLQTAYAKLQGQLQALLAKKQEDKPGVPAQELKKEVFESDEFKNTAWNPYKEMIEKQYVDLGPDWQNRFLEKSRNDLDKL